MEPAPTRHPARHPPRARLLAAALRGVIFRHAAAVASWLLPPLCPRCGARALRPASWYCEACWAVLRGLRPEDARWRLAGEEPPLAARAAFAVDGLFIEMLSASKYRGARPVGRRLGEEASRRLAPRLGPGVLVPVPITAARRRERGFNQPEDFARALAERTGHEVRTDWLVRRRGGRAVAGLDRTLRRDAVRGAFAVRGAGPSGPVILVDDVVTTGSTAGACRAALAGAGAREVSVAAMARAFQCGQDTAVAPSELAERL